MWAVGRRRVGNELVKRQGGGGDREILWLKFCDD